MRVRDEPGLRLDGLVRTEQAVPGKPCTRTTTSHKHEDSDEDEDNDKDEDQDTERTRLRTRTTTECPRVTGTFGYGRGLPFTPYSYSSFLLQKPQSLPTNIFFAS